jgi:hypothetical protein
MDLYYFNPDNEMAIAHGRESYTPPANVARMARELGYLPAYLSGPADCLLVDEKPDVRFLDERHALLKMENRVVTLLEAKQLHFHALRPWGWSPRVDGMLGDLSVDEGGHEGWNPEKKALYGRSTALAVLERVRDDLTLPDAIFPRVESTVEGVVIQARRHALVIKSPWSSSGRGLLMVEAGKVGHKEKEWLTGVLRGQGHVMVEKKLEKLSDFALEFWMEEPGNTRYMGLSRFFTGEKGNYRGNYIGPQARIEQEFTRHVGKPLFQAIRESVARVLQESLGGRYRGPLGVDMMLYRDEEGECRVHPCVEINLRYNMGIVALMLSDRYLAPGSEGVFQLSYFPRAGEACRACMERATGAPLRREAGRVLSGYLLLTPVREDTRFVAEITCREETRKK